MIDPKYFDPNLPEDNSAILFRRKGEKRSQHGLVEYVWFCCDSEAINVRLEDGSRTTIFPELGDEWNHEL